MGAWIQIGWMMCKHPQTRKTCMWIEKANSWNKLQLDSIIMCAYPLKQEMWFFGMTPCGWCLAPGGIWLSQFPMEPWPQRWLEYLQYLLSALYDLLLHLSSCPSAHLSVYLSIHLVCLPVSCRPSNPWSICLWWPTWPTNCLTDYSQMTSCLPRYLRTYLPIWLSTCLSTYPIHPSSYLVSYASVCMSACLSICTGPSLFQSISLASGLPFYRSTSLSGYLATCPIISLFLCVCLLQESSNR